MRTNEYFATAVGGRQKRFLDGEVVYAKEVVTDPLAAVRQG